MAVSLVQTDTASVCGLLVYCSGNSQNTDQESNQAQQGGTAGSTPRTVTVNGSAADLNCIWMECILPAGYDFNGGTWTVPLNVTTGNHQITLDEIHICQVDSACTLIRSLGSAVGIGTNISATQVYSTNVTQSSPALSGGDHKIIIVFAFDNANSMTQDFAYTPDQTITAPGVAQDVGDATGRQWIDPTTGVQFDEDGAEEFIVPVAGAQFQEDQAVAADTFARAFYPNITEKIRMIPSGGSRF